MKKLLAALFLSMAFASTPLVAHHAAADVADAEVYAMIDELISDTPHATMTLEDLMDGGTQVTIDVRSYKDVMDVVDMLMPYIGMLDGSTTITIDNPQGPGFVITLVNMGNNNMNFDD
jgi:hypothetical protein